MSADLDNWHSSSLLDTMEPGSLSPMYSPCRGRWSVICPRLSPTKRWWITPSPLTTLKQARRASWGPRIYCSSCEPLRRDFLTTSCSNSCRWCHPSLNINLANVKRSTDVSPWCHIAVGEPKTSPPPPTSWECAGAGCCSLRFSLPRLLPWGLICGPRIQPREWQPMLGELWYMACSTVGLSLALSTQWFPFCHTRRLLRLAQLHTTCTPCCFSFYYVFMYLCTAVKFCIFLKFT